MPPKKKKLKTALSNLLADVARKKKENYNLAVVEEKRNKAKEKQRLLAQQRLKPTYSENDRILLVGEGNFSFARSLAENYMQQRPSNIVATCFDDESVLYEKYGNEAKSNVQALRDLGVTVLFSVDGTQLEKTKEIKKCKFTKIIFNFPHAGAGIKDQDHNVRANQALINGFLASATPLLTKEGEMIRNNNTSQEDDDSIAAPEGEIHITTKTCKPYDLWDVRTLAKTTGQLAIKTTLPFHPDHYPGYEHRRTLGFKEGVSKANNAEILQANPKTFVIVRKEAMMPEFEKSKQGAIEKKKNLQRQALLPKKKRKHRQTKHSDDDDDDDE